MNRGRYDSNPPRAGDAKSNLTVEYTLFVLACLTMIACIIVLMLYTEAQRDGINYGSYVIEELITKLRAETNQ